MRVTKNNISKAIKEETGLDIKVWTADGYFYFYSDDESTELMLQRLTSKSVYGTTLLSAWTVEGWVEMFTDMLKELED